MIQIKSLTKKYEDLTVLKDINIDIPDGCIYGIIGQSGAGKSTLLRCINGLEKYDSGELLVEGTDVKSLDSKKMLEFRRDIGMIFQNFALLDRKTVIENVMMPMQCWKYSKERMQKRAEELIHRVGLGDKLYAMPRELSGGQKQRVAIARALALEPRILLCDEATSALDPAITKSILELLESINEELGITIVIVTHEMSVVKEACDRVAIVEDGIIVSEGDVEKVFLEDDSALQKLMGDKKLQAPEGKDLVKVLMRGSEEEQSAIYNLAAAGDVPFGIFSANVTPFHNKHQMGHIYLTTEAGNGQALVNKLKDAGIDAETGKEF